MAYSIAPVPLVDIYRADRLSNIQTENVQALSNQDGVYCILTKYYFQVEKIFTYSVE